MPPTMYLDFSCQRRMLEYVYEAVLYVLLQTSTSDCLLYASGRHGTQPACRTIHNYLLKEPRDMTMTINTHLSPIIAIVVGILILIFPRFLNYFIAVYLIVTGLIGLGMLR